MSKAEQRALEAYPKDIEEYIDVNGIKSAVDNNSWQRTLFLKGYHQAEKDLELTWEDLATIEKLGVDFIKQNHTPMSDEEYFKEVLKRFKEIKSK